ncbi:SDR family oxidoreductase [Pelosinus sp. sgz500959]|uniref:SDR family oxidoreductase n=1 Tax=Pelosinus sp. sgz500959 TaxID=3242472 RepID=UPI00366F9C80
MNMTDNTILITGGASGIGLALAERFLQRGNEVIICGRREDKLQEAKEKFPQLHIRVCDVAKECDRKSLVVWALHEFPKLNILVNNAGIQQRVNLLEATADWNYYHQEISANQEAPIHLSMLLIPHLMRKKEAVIVNVTSGLAFVPPAWVPIYGATKAAMHSFTVSLRLQVEKSNINVVEVLPPAVNTDLGGVGLHTFGEPLDEFADAVFEGFENGDLEIGYRSSEKVIRASRDEIDEIVMRNWERLQIPKI